MAVNGTPSKLSVKWVRGEAARLRFASDEIPHRTSRNPREEENRCQESLSVFVRSNFVQVAWTAIVIGWSNAFAIGSVTLTVVPD
jgi:hypothetical protein